MREKQLPDGNKYIKRRGGGAKKHTNEFTITFISHTAGRKTMRRYKFLDKTNPHFIEAIVHERTGTLVKVPAFWWNKDVYVYFDDGNIEKKRTISNSNSWTHIRIPVCYKNQKVKIRLVEKVECENLKKYL